MGVGGAVVAVGGVRGWLDTAAAVAAFVGLAAGLAGLLLYRSLREALTASREANATLRESLGDEKVARESADARHTEETHAAALKIEGLTAKVELLQSSWVTEIALAVAHAVATGQRAALEHGEHHQPRRPRGGSADG